MSEPEREALAEVISQPLDVSGIHKAVPVVIEDRIADAILASDWLAQVKATARAEVWDEGYARAMLDRYEAMWDPGGQSVNPYRPLGGAR